MSPLSVHYELGPAHCPGFSRCSLLACYVRSWSLDELQSRPGEDSAQGTSRDPLDGEQQLGLPAARWSLQAVARRMEEEQGGGVHEGVLCAERRSNLCRCWVTNRACCQDEIWAGGGIRCSWWLLVVLSHPVKTAMGQDKRKNTRGSGSWGKQRLERRVRTSGIGG
ncbi:hypothetical protein Droror1_Dr00024347 [Drosera rotundifolia]